MDALSAAMQAPCLPTAIASIMLANGSGKVPAGFLVFKTCGGSRCGPRWVRLPSTPAAMTTSGGAVQNRMPLV
jgi:hypothetical protein